MYYKSKSMKQIDIRLNKNEMSLLKVLVWDRLLGPALKNITDIWQNLLINE